MTPSPPTPPPLDPPARALVDLGRWLLAAGYRFTTVTPATHARVVARRGFSSGDALRDAFGWSLPFDPGALPARAIELLGAAGALDRGGGRARSRVRFSSLGDGLYAHSAFPTDAPDAVFFGPDTYRFVAFLRRHAPPAGGRIVDVGCGSGAGGLAWAAGRARVVLADVNPRALDFARANAALAGAGGAEFALSDVLAGVGGELDAVVANPPYLVDEAGRAYRHGGGGLGTELAARIVREGLARVRPGGRVLLYTGAPVAGGRDVLREALAPSLEAAGARYEYEELDPDVFGEELDRPAYAQAGVERIAVVGVSATSPA